MAFDDDGRGRRRQDYDNSDNRQSSGYGNNGSSRGTGYYTPQDDRRQQNFAGDRGRDQGSNFKSGQYGRDGSASERAPRPPQGGGGSGSAPGFGEHRPRDRDERSRPDSRGGGYQGDSDRGRDFNSRGGGGGNDAREFRAARSPAPGAQRGGNFDDRNRGNSFGQNRNSYDDRRNDDRGGRPQNFDRGGHDDRRNGDFRNNDQSNGQHNNYDRGNQGRFDNNRRDDRGGFANNSSKGFYRDDDRNDARQGGGFGRQNGGEFNSNRNQNDDRGGQDRSSAFGRQNVGGGGSRGGQNQYNDRNDDRYDNKSNGFGRQNDNGFNRSNFNSGGGNSGGNGYDRDNGFSRGNGFERQGNSGFQGGNSFGNDSQGFRNGSGFQHNEQRGFQSGGGNFRGGRNDDHFGRGFNNDGGFENSGGGDAGGGQGILDKERAPKDWMPEMLDVDEMIQKIANNASELNIDEDQKLEIRNSDISAELSSWENSGLHPTILRNVANCGYTNVRAIQAAVIPQLMAGYDLCGQAETGGGKTAAFALPIIHKIMEIPEEERERDGRNSAPYCFILAPVRELAKQIYETLNTYAKGTDVKVQLTYGEMNRWDCLRKIQEGCHILVGTCGRIMDYIQKGEITFGNLRFFVLDEADRLLEDMAKGSGSHLEAIMDDSKFKQSSEIRQTLLFSATFSSLVEQTAKQMMKTIPGQSDVVRIVLSQGRINPRVHLHFIETGGIRDKCEKLRELTQRKSNRYPRTLVFVEQKKRTDYVAMEIQKDNIRAESINGDRPQNIREQILKKFRDGEIDVLVGTDVCSRGLDIPDLERVINYDLPKASVESATDTFIHRVGRCGRLKKGDAYSFVCADFANDMQLIPALVELVKTLKREDTLPDFMKDYSSGSSYNQPNTFTSTGNFGSTGFSSSSGFRTSDNTGGFKESGFGSNTTGAPMSGFGKASFGSSSFSKKNVEENAEDGDDENEKEKEEKNEDGETTEKKEPKEEEEYEW